MSPAEAGPGGDVSQPPAAACRSCGSHQLEPILSLGRLPLANAYPAAEDLREEQRHPLDLIWCGSCSLVQLAHTVPPERMFGDYLYLSSYSDTMLAHARELAGRLMRERRLGTDSLVIEAASNDGYLLKEFAAAGVPVLGIEPAANVAEIATREHGVRTRAEYFGQGLARRLKREGMAADVFLGLNVMAHVPDTNGFVEGIGLVLKEDGLAVIEVPYLVDLIEKIEFDTIYHEHVFYYSLHALLPLLRRHGLTIASVERLPIHGGSIRVFIQHGAEAGPAVKRSLEAEASLGVGQASYYRQFGDRVRSCRDSLVALLARLKREGARIAAYGAAAKGTIMLNSCGIGMDVLDFVADRNPHKQGRRMPGVGIPILPPEALVERRPDYVLLLAWNFAEEILRQQAAYLKGGGRFIHPIPAARIL